MKPREAYRITAARAANYDDLFRQLLEDPDRDTFEPLLKGLRELEDSKGRLDRIDERAQYLDELAGELARLGKLRLKADLVSLAEAERSRSAAEAKIEQRIRDPHGETYAFSFDKVLNAISDRRGATLAWLARTLDKRAGKSRGAAARSTSWPNGSPFRSRPCIPPSRSWLLKGWSRSGRRRAPARRRRCASRRRGASRRRPRPAVSWRPRFAPRSGSGSGRPPRSTASATNTSRCSGTSSSATSWAARGTGTPPLARLRRDAGHDDELSVSNFERKWKA